MEGIGDLEEGGGLMELLGPGDLLYLDGDEGKLFSQFSPALCSPPPCSSTSFSDNSAAATHGMLCFASGASQKSSDSSLSTICSSSPRSTSATSSKASKKVEVGGGGRGGRRNTTAAAGGSAASKKTKTEASARPGTIKVRKAKLGERILSLQQLVSPFGKTDTASVLHEAMSYIQFLHDQVQVLSTPYLQRLPSSARLNVADGGRRGEEPTMSNLRSRGLCLVPVSCTERVAHSSSNGADFWASATGSNSSSSATTTTMQ